ncbi:caspase recruitment domain-containing protein 11-like, partial [Glandiceps talaboti]
VKVLDPTRLFDELRSQRVLDGDDCEEIDCQSKYPTMTKRAGKFLDILMAKGPIACNKFCEVLERKHPHLYKIITGNEPRNLADAGTVIFLSVRGVLFSSADSPDSTEFIAKLAKKVNILSKEKTELQEKVWELDSKRLEVLKENDRLKKKNVLNQYQKVLNKKLKKTLREFEEKLHQVTEDKCDAVSMSLNYQHEKELAQERLHQALIETEELRRLLNRAEGDCKFERSQSKRLRYELSEKPKTELVEALNKEVHLLKTELSQHMSNQKVRQSMSLDDNDRIAILESEREEARNELKQTVDLLFASRQECHAVEHKRDELSIRVQQLEKEHDIMLNDCETYKKRKEELWEQLKEREKERNQAIRERDCALKDCALKAGERDELFRKFYRLQDEYDTLEQQHRMLKQHNGTGSLFESESEVRNEQVRNEDEAFQDNGIILSRNFRKRSQHVLKKSNSAEGMNTEQTDDVFESFTEWTSTEDILSSIHHRPLSDSCRVHPGSSITRQVVSRKVFSDRATTLSGLSQLSDSSDDEDTQPIKRRVCLRKKIGSQDIRRSQSCTELTRTLEDMIPNFTDSSSCEARSSINTHTTDTSPSLRTTGTDSRQSATSDYVSDMCDGQQYDVLVYGSSLLTDFAIKGGNSRGIFINAVKSQPNAAKHEITVGDQLIKVTGNVGGKHRIESLVGFTLEQAHNFLEKAYGWIKLSLRRKKAESKEEVIATSDDSFFVRANFSNVPGKGEEGEFTLAFEPGDILHVTNTAHDGVIGVWYAEQVKVGTPSEGTIPNYHKGYNMFIKQTETPTRRPMKRTPSESVYATGCFPIDVKPSFRGKVKSKSVRESRTMQKLGPHATLPYIFVDGIKVNECRPVLMVGAEGLVRLIQNQLCLSDITKDLFEVCATEDIVCTEEEMDLQKKETGDVIDSIKEDKLFKCITVANIKAVTNKNKHCLCYVDDVNRAITKLHAVHIYPIVVVLHLRNPDQKDPHALFIIGDQSVDKMKERLLRAEDNERTLNMTHPKTYETMIVGGVDRPSINKIVRSISSKVKEEQLKEPNVWVESVKVIVPFNK